MEEKVNNERILTVEEMEKRFDNIKTERNELLKASEVASDNIRLKGTIFAILLGLLVNISITQRSAEKFWMLITLVSIMLTGTEFIAWGAFKEMLQVDQELKLLMLNEFRWYTDWEEYDNSLPQNMNQLLLLKVNEVRDIYLKWNREPINDTWGKVKSYFTEPFEIRLVRDIPVNTWLILTVCIIFQLMLPVQLIISLHDFVKILSNAPTPASPSPSILQHFLGF